MDLSCGSEVCPLGGQNACCWANYAFPQSAQCVQGPVDNDMCFTDQFGLETRIECELPSQCNTGICCAHRVFLSSQQSYYDLVSCEQSCNYPDILLCDPLAPDYCPQIDVNGNLVQTVCTGSKLLPPGYDVCAIQ